MTRGIRTKVVVAATIAALLGTVGATLARDRSRSCGMKGRDLHGRAHVERGRTETGRADASRSIGDGVTTNAGRVIVRRTSDVIVVTDPSSRRHDRARTF